MKRQIRMHIVDSYTYLSYSYAYPSNFSYTSQQRTVTNYSEKEKTEPFPKTQASFRIRSTATVKRSVSSQPRTVTNYLEKEKTEPFPKTQASFRTRKNRLHRSPSQYRILFYWKRHVNTQLLSYRKRQDCTVQHCILLILKNSRSPCQHRILVVAKKTSLNASSSQHRNLVISKKIWPHRSPLPIQNLNMHERQTAWKKKSLNRSQRPKPHLVWSQQRTSFRIRRAATAVI